MSSDLQISSLRDRWETAENGMAVDRNHSRRAEFPKIRKMEAFRLSLDSEPLASHHGALALQI